MTVRALGFALLGALAVATPASALTIAVANGAPQITLRVGQTGGTISLVTFTVPAASAGNGVPIDGVSNAASRAAQAGFPACAAGVRIWARARSTASSASQPQAWLRDAGLPKCSRSQGIIASTTRGSTGVVAP